METKRMISLYTTQFEDGTEFPNTDEELDIYWMAFDEIKRRGYTRVYRGVYVGLVEVEDDFWEAIILEDGTREEIYIELDLIPCLHVN